MATIDVIGLRKRFGDVDVLRGIELAVRDGEFVTLLGPSGCGKTTTLRCVAGLERPDGGEVRIGGEPVASATKRLFVPPEKREIGMVFQNYALWPHMSVYANVAYPLRMRKHPRAEIRPRVLDALEAVGIAAYADRLSSQLSGGQQQRVALARAIVGSPRLLLFDEPLSNLDARLRASMRREVRAAHDRIGTTSLYVTHDQEEAITLSDRVIVMREGAIEQIGPPADIYERPRTRFVADFVGFENVVAAPVVARREGAAAVRLSPDGPAVWCDVTGLGDAGRDAERLDVAVRSEHVGLAAAGAAAGATGRDGAAGPLGSPAENVVAGEVVDATYVGSEVEYAVRVGGNRLVVRHAGERAEVGTTVALELPVARIVALAPEGTERLTPAQREMEFSR